MKTLYVSDLDGTLLNPEAEITPFTRRTLNRLAADGMNFTFATARSVYSAVPLMSGVDLKEPCILMNGVSVYDMENKRCIKNEYIPVEASAAVLRAFEENNVRCFMYRIEEETLICYYSKLTTKVMRSFAESRQKQYLKPFEQCERLIDRADENAVYFTTTGPREVLLPVREAVERIDGVDCAFYLDVYNGEWYLEVFSHKASKYNAVRFIREKYGFERVVAFGDNLNDLSMFEAADVKVAVGNARDELKAAADIVIGTNTEEGVARWLTENYR